MDFWLLERSASGNLRVCWRFGRFAAAFGVNLGAFGGDLVSLGTSQNGDDLPQGFWDSDMCLQNSGLRHFHWATLGLLFLSSRETSYQRGGCDMFYVVPLFEQIPDDLWVAEIHKIGSQNKAIELGQLPLKLGDVSVSTEELSIVKQTKWLTQ